MLLAPHVKLMVVEISLNILCSQYNGSEKESMLNVLVVRNVLN
jgi:hypothetical protein